MLATYLGIAIIVTVLVLIYIYSELTFNIGLVIYVVSAISVIAGGTLTAFNSGKTLTAVLFFMGALAIFVIFGLKWFSPGSVFAKTPVSWPPTINTCPDYLVHYVRTKDGKPENTCIDLIGISKKGNGGLNIFPKDALNGISLPPSNDSYYFSLKTDSSDSIDKNKQLCTRAIAAGLTWEGITNGESCVIDNSVGPDGTVIPAGCPKSS